MAAWEEKVKAGQPEWMVLRPEVEDESTGGQKYLPLADGSFLAQGYAPTKHTVKMTVKTDVKNITAFRLELLNDPNLPLGGPGRSIKGTAALTEFAVDAEAGGKVRRLKFVRATADVNPPETPLDPIFDDKSGKKRVTGPASFAIDGKDETAWGIDGGPAAATSRARRCSLSTSRSLPRRRDADVPPDAEPRRLEQRRQPEPQPRPLPPVDHDRARRRGRPVPAACAILDPPRQADAGAGGAVFGYWRTTVPEWKDANERIEALWKAHPEGRRNWCSSRERPRDTHILKRGDFLKPGRRSSPACRRS